MGMTNKLLFITHQLSRTGAPIVLLDMIKLCLNAGFSVEVISLLPGELADELDALQVPISYKDDFWADRENFKVYASRYDGVIANTLITYQVIHALSGTDVPVLWWLHEGVQYFDYFAKVLPDFARLPANIHVYSVSHYVAAVVREKYGCKTEVLHFSIADQYEKIMASNEPDPWFSIFADAAVSAPIRFFTCGTYSKVKAQDVLVQAVQLLSPAEQENCLFLCCGSEDQVDPDVFGAVCEASALYPTLFKHIGSVPREDVLRLMVSCDFLIVPSRIEPMSAVAIEAMMLKKPVLITDVCGVAHYVTNGINGLTMRADDAAQLADKIREAIVIRTNGKSYQRMASLSGKIYGNYFSDEVVSPKMLSIIRQLARS